MEGKILDFFHLERNAIQAAAHEEDEAGAGLLSLSASRSCSSQQQDNVNQQHHDKDCDTRLSLGLNFSMARKGEANGDSNDKSSMVRGATNDASSSSQQQALGLEGSSSGANNYMNLRRRKSSIEHLFTKVLQVSDVNKLNRLVIPKHHARRCFPKLQEGSSSDGSDSKAEPTELELTFSDDNGHDWTFNYKYWCSSKTYVFSKGWSHFVKRYQLEHGDEVSLLRDNETGEHYISFKHKLRSKAS